MKLIRSQRGNASLLIAFSLVGLLAIAGLAIDGGMMYSIKSHLKKTANAAALSGAQELTNSEQAVQNVVARILQEHGESLSLQGLQIQNGQKVTVSLQKVVQPPFMRIFGFHSIPIEARSTAEILTMARAAGAAPLGINEAIQLEYYKRYSLKVDTTGVESGVFGVLALGGTGANTYEDNLKNGFSGEIRVNDVLPTQTGNIAGRTRNGVNERIRNCPYQKGETHHRDCPRVILIPVYKPHNQDSSQMKEIQVTGFAYFYILEQMSNNDTSIVGMFIRRAGVGFVDPTVINKGAFSIRLTE